MEKSRKNRNERHRMAMTWRPDHQHQMQRSKKHQNKTKAQTVVLKSYHFPRRRQPHRRRHDQVHHHRLLTPWSVIHHGFQHPLQQQRQQHPIHQITWIHTAPKRDAKHSNTFCLAKILMNLWLNIGKSSPFTLTVRTVPVISIGWKYHVKRLTKCYAIIRLNSQKIWMSHRMKMVYGKRTIQVLHFFCLSPHLVEPNSKNLILLNFFSLSLDGRAYAALVWQYYAQGCSIRKSI